MEVRQVRCRDVSGSQRGRRHRGRSRVERGLIADGWGTANHRSPIRGVATIIGEANVRPCWREDDWAAVDGSDQAAQLAAEANSWRGIAAYLARRDQAESDANGGRFGRGSRIRIGRDERREGQGVRRGIGWEAEGPPSAPCWGRQPRPTAANGAGCPARAAPSPCPWGTFGDPRTGDGGRPRRGANDRQGGGAGRVDRLAEPDRVRGEGRGLGYAERSRPRARWRVESSPPSLAGGANASVAPKGRPRRSLEEMP